MRGMGKGSRAKAKDNEEEKEYNRSAMLDEALQVIHYTIEPQIADDDRKKPWIWMDKLRLHYTGSIGSSLLADRFKF